MANVFAAFHRALRTSTTARVAHPCRHVRQIRVFHSTPATLKKKEQSTATDADDLFGDSANESDSLFPENDVSSASKPSAAAPVEADVQDITSTNPSLPAPRKFDRKSRFERIYHFAESTIVTKTDTTRQPRHTIWHHLLSNATTGSQIERVVEMFPKWRESQKPFTNNLPEHFALRCLKTRSPRIALKVFGDRPKYGLDLSPQAARIVLFSLIQRTRPVQEVITFTSLFNVYNLPPVSSDLTCTALVVRSCLREGSAESLEVARALVPSLQQLVEKSAVEEKSATEPSKETWVYPRQQMWLESALRIVASGLQKHEIEHGWLNDWLNARGVAEAVPS